MTAQHSASQLTELPQRNVLEGRFGALTFTEGWLTMKTEQL